jgi:hypothetical protein
MTESSLPPFMAAGFVLCGIHAEAFMLNYIIIQAGMA